MGFENFSMEPPNRWDVGSPTVINPRYAAVLLTQIDDAMASFIGSKVQEGKIEYIKSVITQLARQWFLHLDALGVFKQRRGRYDIPAYMREALTEDYQSPRHYDLQRELPLQVVVREEHTGCFSYRLAFDEKWFLMTFGMTVDEFFRRPDVVSISAVQQAELQSEIDRLHRELELRKRQYEDAFISPVRARVADFTLT